MSWNVDGLKMWRMGVPELVRREQPDVLGIIQHKLSAEAKYSLAGYETKALNANALLLVRSEVAAAAVDVSTCELTASDDAKVIVAEFENIIVVLANPPSAGDNLTRLTERTGSFDVQLRAKLAELEAKKPTLLIGDLNIAHRDEDVWNSDSSKTK